MKRIISSNREKYKEVEIIDNIIPIELKLTREGDMFLQYSDLEEKFLVFFNEKHKKYIEDCEVFCCDGTFETAPPGFSQIYIFQCHIFKRNFPMIFCILKDKSYNTYLKMLNFLKEKIIFKDSIRFIVDFEIGFIKALKNVFKNVIVNYCFFHFKNSIKKNIKKHNLETEYKINPIIRRNLILIMTLPFARYVDIKNIFYEIKERLNLICVDVKLLQFLEYFERNYIGNDNKTLFQPIEWSLTDRILNDFPLTTNSCEGWNHGWNNEFMNPHPKLCMVIKELQNKEMKSRLELIKLTKSVFYGEYKPYINLKNEKYKKFQEIIDKYGYWNYFDCILGIED